MPDTRVAIITGGATGIGAAAVSHFAERGWNVLLCYFGADEMPCAEELARKSGGAGRRVVATPLDVTQDSECREAVARAVAEFGRIDALISSAGTMRVVPQPMLEKLRAEDFENSMRVNTLGPFQMARACAQQLRSSRGAVVIVSSYGGVHGAGSSMAYAASKGAANTLTMSLARVLAPEVRVNAVCPAIVSGGYLARVDPEGFAERLAGQIRRAPLAKVANPEEVARDIYWLAAETSLMTGQLILLDCGLHLNADSIG